MSTDHVCEEHGDHPAIVGYGTPPVWLCLEAYQERLRKFGDTLRRLREGVDVRGDEAGEGPATR